MKWISVKDRLPADKVVLCYGDNGEAFIAQYSSEYGFESNDYCHSEYCSQPEVTHWMPLPEEPEK